MTAIINLSYSLPHLLRNFEYIQQVNTRAVRESICSIVKMHTVFTAMHVVTVYQTAVRKSMKSFVNSRFRVDDQSLLSHISTFIYLSLLFHLYFNARTESILIMTTRQSEFTVKRMSSVWIRLVDKHVEG